MDGVGGRDNVLVPIGKGKRVLLIFAGGHRMGSTYQFLIGINALKQLGIPIRGTDNPALNIFHLQKIRTAFKVADLQPETYLVAKTHPAFPEQAEAVLSAKHSRVFLVWRDQTDALVSDYHFAQRRAGHVYAGFDDYFVRRGRKILLRNCLQQRVWQGIKDERVRAWDYLDLVDNFETAVPEMLNFAGLKNVDLDKLKESVSIEQLRKTHDDPKGTFFRKGGKQDIQQLKPGPGTLDAVEKILGESDVAHLGAEYEREDWMRVLAFGRECRDAGFRKTFHWWLYKTRRAQRLRDEMLPHVYKFSPRRLSLTRGD
jgi:hypothetical protein